MKDPAAKSNDGTSQEQSQPGLGIHRRAVLLAGLGALAGCASSTSTGRLPSPLWPKSREIVAGGTLVPTPTPVPGSTAGTISRASWAQGGPITSRVNPMLPPKRITIHHDGMPPFTSTDLRLVGARIDLIRRAHLNRDGGNRWGDIGYHFIVDRAGRAWEGRPLIYQGAHVKNYNEGNIGILCLGNYEQQVPTQAQIRQLEQLVQRLRGQYRIRRGEVHTHRELCNNCTLCPGVNLQREIVASRSAGRLG